MPTTWQAWFKYETTTTPESADHKVRLFEIPDDPYIPPQTVSFYGRDINSNITGYKALKKTNGSSNKIAYNATFASSETVTLTLEEFVTDETGGVENHMIDGKRAFTYTAWWDRTGPEQALVKVKCEVYHRDSAGYETLITSFLQVVTRTETQYTTDVNMNEIFEEGERLVIKWSMVFTPVGGS